MKTPRPHSTLTALHVWGWLLLQSEPQSVDTTTAALPISRGNAWEKLLLLESLKLASVVALRPTMLPSGAAGKPARLFHSQLPISMTLIASDSSTDHIQSIRTHGWDLSIDAHLCAMAQGLIHLGHRYSIATIGDGDQMEWQMGWTDRGHEIWGMRLPTLRRAMEDAMARVWNAARGKPLGNGDAPPNRRLADHRVHLSFQATSDMTERFTHLQGLINGERRLLLGAGI